MRIETFLEQSPMFAVQRAARRFEALAAEALAGEDLGFLEGLTLAALFFEGARQVKPSQLAEAFATTRSNVSHCVSRLEARGLVRRATDADDARVFHLHLRPQGRRAAVRVIGALDKLQRGFERELGKAALKEMLAGLRQLEALHAAQV
jgi:DNA-binding MarR family transcriptional regulator